MKKLFAVLALCTMAAFVSHADPFAGIGPATVKLTAVAQNEIFTLTHTKTNAMSASTNVTLVFKSTVITSNLDSSGLLALIENSFNTNFPAGSQVAFAEESVFIVDHTGTNIIFDPGSVVFFQFLTPPISKAIQTAVLHESSGATTVSGNETGTQVAGVNLVYNDISETPADGKNSNFQLGGILTESGTLNLATGLTHATTSFTGGGGGYIRFVPTVVSGTFTAKRIGTPPP